MAEGARFGRLRSLRRRVAHAVAEAQDKEQLRAELAAVRAELAEVKSAYARDGQLFVAHRAAWDRERARLIAGLPLDPPVAAAFARAEREIARVRGKLINLDERRAR